RAVPTGNPIRCIPPNGRVMSVTEVSQAIEASEDLHQLMGTISLLNSARRVAIVLDDQQRDGRTTPDMEPR
ncbi:hypothetical protein WDZ92_53665, partial [Nostoc sp. NIES-2111]